MSSLEIELFGGFRLRYAGELVTAISQPLVQSLLSYLVIHRNMPQPRHHTAAVFWPEASDGDSRRNLRNKVFTLRNQLPDSDRFLVVDNNILNWRSEADFTLDVAVFEDLLMSAEAVHYGEDEVRRLLEAAVACYRGELLPGFYDDWILNARERLRLMYIAALEKLIAILEMQHDYPSAIYYAQRLLLTDPVHEAAYRCLMRLHALNRDLPHALRIYQECVATLWRELNVEPSTETQTLYQQILKRDVRSDILEGTKASTNTVLVGRRSEQQTLQNAWRSALQKQTHFFLLKGDAGIGKTRLIDDVVWQCGRHGVAVAVTRCFRGAGDLAYAPIVKWLRSDLIFPHVRELDEIWRVELSHLLPELLTLDSKLRSPGPIINRRQRQRLFEALERAITTPLQPLVLVIDDLQWCDQESIEWLHYLLHTESDADVVLVGAVRTDEIGYGEKTSALLLDLRRAQRLTELEIDALDSVETGVLAAHVAGTELAADRADYIYRETEGNPLFVVEMVRSGRYLVGAEQVQGGPSLEPAVSAPSLPPVIQDVIMHRLAQLSPDARRLVDCAAVIGREFSVDVLLEAVDMREEVLVEGIDELWQRHIVREQGAVTYDFSHDKIREVAYAELGAARRRLLHRRVALALASVYSADSKAISGQMAVHFERSGMHVEAILNLITAAQSAQLVYAYNDAFRHLHHALHLLDSMPSSRRRSELECAVQMSLGSTSILPQGFAADGVAQAFERAVQLGRQLGDDQQMARALAGLSVHYLVKGDQLLAERNAQEILTLVRQYDLTDHDLVAHYLLGATSLFQGNLDMARYHLRHAVNAYAPADAWRLLATYGYDPGVAAMSYLPLVLWLLGHQSDALAQDLAVQQVVADNADPHNAIFANSMAVVLYQLHGDIDKLRRQVAQLIRDAQQHGAVQWEAHGRIFRGWMTVQQGRSEGVTEMEEGLVHWQMTGATLAVPYYLTMMAQAYGRIGAIATALDVLEQAMTVMNSGHECWYHAEVHRCKGDLLLANGAEPALAERCYLDALAIAERQDAESLRVKAVQSLVRLLHQQDRHLEARQIVSEVYVHGAEPYARKGLSAVASLFHEVQ